jgi:hypothetical protein
MHLESIPGVTVLDCDMFRMRLISTRALLDSFHPTGWNILDCRC